MYFVPQLGQAKAIGSDLFEKQRAAICPQYVNSAAQCLADFGQYIVCLGHFMCDEARRIAANIAKQGKFIPATPRSRRLIDAGLFSCDRICRRLRFATRRLAILRQSIWRLGCGDRDRCCAGPSSINREGTNWPLTRDEARRIAVNVAKLPGKPTSAIRTKKLRIPGAG
jgi:hypothetical protein